MPKLLLLLTVVLIGAYLLYITHGQTELVTPHIPRPAFEIRSIDTMKYSRDLARDKSSSPEFDPIIDSQMKAIAATGATHVAIGTPYDAEFVPFLVKWVTAARRYNLHVWFRGNLAGWEQWFGYSPISRAEHTAAVVKFIRNNSSLFESGDIFTPCPECENGGSGDPRQTGDVEGFRNFLISERQEVKKSFDLSGKQVSVDIQSMNYDVARLVMDKNTTAALGGVVGIDHYVKDPVRLANDIIEIAKSSGGKVILSEIGAPIPDIHGKMSASDQAEWLRQVLSRISSDNSVIGINYWVGVGGSTAVWQDNGEPKPAVDVLTEYFHLWK